MSDAELVIVLVAAAILILAVCLSSLRRRRLIGQIIGYLTEPGLSARRISPSYSAVSAEATACVTFMQ